MQMDKFIEDTKLLMSEPVASPNCTMEPELISVNLPHDFTFKHSYSSSGSQHTFDNTQQMDSHIEENVKSEESFGQKVYSAFSRIGEGFSNFFGCSRCMEEKKPPKYDLENLPSGLSSFFNSGRLMGQQQQPDETLGSGSDGDSLGNGQNVYKTPRMDGYNCFNSLNMFKKSPDKTVQQSKYMCIPCFDPKKSNMEGKHPVAYKLHAIEIHQPISCYSSSLGHPAVISNSAQLLQNGLKALDENFSGVPAMTMGQIIQQHNRAIAVNN